MPPPFATRSGPVVILADDLSGAAELAGIAFQRGQTAEVQRRVDVSATAQVVAIDTDSRHLSAAGAAACLRATFEQLAGFQPAFVYKKVDSLLRGNVRAEIEAMMQVAGYRRTILAPANPSRGRVIVGGRYFIDGQPLDQTPLAHDPHHPRHSAEVVSLLGEGGQRLHSIRQAATLPSSGIIITDISTHAELQELANQVDEQTLVAGAADYFESLLEIRENRSHPFDPCTVAPLILPPALLVCGSRMAWTARLRDCRAEGIAAVTIDDPWPSSIPPALLVGIGERATGNQAALLSRLADMAQTIIARHYPRTLLLEGGATAAALAERLGWTRFALAAAATTGIGVLRPSVTDAPLVMIKPGSYPWPAEIWSSFLRVATA